MTKTGKGDRICSACGEKGHYKNSNKCPKKKESEEQGAAEGSRVKKVEKKRVKEAKEKKEGEEQKKEEEKESSEIPTGDEEEEEDKGSSGGGDESKVVKPRKEETKKKKKSKKSKWADGAVLLAEMGRPNDYEDTFHPVRIMHVLEGGTKYMCQFLAFDLKDASVFEEHELHELFEPQPDATYKVGDKVVAKIVHRKVRGKEVDGREKGSGVWVKAKVVAVNKDANTVKVEYNNCNDGTSTITLDKKKLSQR